MKRTFILLLTALFLAGCGNPQIQSNHNVDHNNNAIYKAFLDQKSNIWVETCGEVDRLLSDDQTGNQHQKFIVRLENDQTVLISHNIDIAPRVKDIQIGKDICFRGEYEWNEKGGVVHWTHHDPSFKKNGGWIQYNNQRYE